MLAALMLSLLATTGFGQTYSAFGVAPSGGDYDTLTKNEDTLRFSFQNIPVGVWGTVTVRVFFEGDFGASGENLRLEDENQNNLGSTPSLGTDCLPEDSVDFFFPAADLISMNADMVVLFELISTINVDLFCTNNRAKIKMIVNYCSAGTPAQIAELSISDSTVCPLGSLYTLTGIPSGGTYSGAGVNGTQFDPSGLASGSYTLLYEVTDNTGCEMTDDVVVTVLRAPIVQDTTIVCPDGQLAINTGFNEYVWAADNMFSVIYDTTANFVSPNLIQTTDFYLAGINGLNLFQVTDLGITNSAVVDHDALTGDDRGGVIVTQSHVYVIGDNAVGRFDLDLTNPQSYQINDGLFSDLNNGSLYTIHNGTDFPYNWPSGYSFSQIRGLNADLTPNGTVIPLSMSIPMSNLNYNNGIFAGAGLLIIYSGETQHWYSVEINTGVVTDHGLDANPNFYWSENWADWGVAEFDGTDYYALYRNNSVGHEIERIKLSDLSITTAFTFTDISDLASFTFAPWLNRWYFHYELSGQFGGSSETIGYADGQHTMVLGQGALGCYSKTTALVNEISLGMDTTICEGQVPFTLYGGVGYFSYTWNGQNTNFNTYNVTQTGEYILEVVDIDNCTLTDTVAVTVEACAGLEEQEMFDEVAIFPNPTSGIFDVQINTNSDKQISFEILDVQGAVLSSQTLVMIPGLNTVSFNVESLSPGIYFLKLKGADNQRSYKVIKK